MATIGSIEPYDPSSGDWEAYQERLEMFLDANAVAEGQRVATLLRAWSHCGRFFDYHR